MQTHARRCPRCEGDTPRTLARYTREHWRIVRCLGCQFVYVPTAPDYGELATNLAWEKTSKQERQSRQTRTPRTRKLVRRLRAPFRAWRSNEAALFQKHLPPGEVLDVGCGDGIRVPAGFTPYGIEISEGLWREADRRMRERGGWAVHAPALEGLATFADGFFAGILMRSYLEHEDRPREVLEGAYRKLKPGGMVFVRVPNFGSLNARLLGRNWCGIRLPDHLNYFTAAQLGAMADVIGFGFRPLNPWSLSTDDNVKALLVKPS